MFTCPVCGKNLQGHVDDLLRCPQCKTRYDFVNRKVDNSETVINPGSCRHREMEFVEGSNWSGDSSHGRYNVYICLDCGKIRVVGNSDGWPYKVEFTLETDTAVKAAGKWRALLAAEIGSREDAT